VTLRQVSDFKGQELVDRFFKLIESHRPLHVSIVGGEPLVRYRELGEILPHLSKMGIYSQVVTSAVRPVPSEWIGIPRLKIVVSIDGLVKPEHDERRKPARSIASSNTSKDIRSPSLHGHAATVAPRRIWRSSAVLVREPDTGQIWISLYTPQIGEDSDERLTPADRQRVVAALMHLRKGFPKLTLPAGLIEVYERPPQSPDDCIFAQTTTCVSADFQRTISPCQFGGKPDCSNCGCIASAGLKAVGRHRLPGGIRVGAVFEHSLAVGRHVRRVLG
jgi:hypothetical protein